MCTSKTAANRAARRMRWLIACAAAGAPSFAASSVNPAYAHDEPDAPPNVPPSLQVPAGNELFFSGHAIGVQIYQCTATGWTFVAPSAVLSDDEPAVQSNGKRKQIAIHYVGPTWQANDGSTVTGQKIAAVAVAGAIPELLLETVVTTAGPGGDTLTDTTYIQRLDTTGGVAPTTGCDATHLGAYAGVPYTADYFFYEAP
jgi:uncharacterized protein DUF3455